MVCARGTRKDLHPEFGTLSDEQAQTWSSVPIPGCDRHNPNPTREDTQLLLDVKAIDVDNDDATPKLNPQPPDNDMTVDDDDGAEEQKERPKRNTCRPQFYQSDEVEKNGKGEKEVKPTLISYRSSKPVSTLLTPLPQGPS